jgi:hypothetical protein
VLKAVEVDMELAFSVAQSLIEYGPLGRSEFMAACGFEIGYQFLANNVFVVGSDGLCGFEDKVTEDAVRIGLVQWS